MFGGHLTARLELLTRGVVTGNWQFGATTKQSPYLTAVAGVDALPLLFAIGYSSRSCARCAACAAA